MNRPRSNSEKWQDLELRLAPSFLLKERAFGFIRRPPEFIIIEDDDGDDDEPVYAPTSLETRSFFPCPNSLVPAIGEGDLDLRLGLGASDGSSGDTNVWDTCAWKCSEASRSYFYMGIHRGEIKMCYLYGYHERGDINIVRAHLLHALHHQHHPSTEEMPNLRQGALAQ